MKAIVFEGFKCAVIVTKEDSLVSVSWPSYIGDTAACNTLKSLGIDDTAKKVLLSGSRFQLDHEFFNEKTQEKIAKYFGKEVDLASLIIERGTGLEISALPLYESGKYVEVKLDQEAAAYKFACLMAKKFLKQVISVQVQTDVRKLTDWGYSTSYLRTASGGQSFAELCNVADDKYEAKVNLRVNDALREFGLIRVETHSYSNLEAICDDLVSKYMLSK